MIKLRSLPLYALASVCFSPIVALAQIAAPAVRIVNPIDESQRVTLAHTVHPLANAANDRGAAPDGMLLDRIQLVLQRSADQEAALRQLITQIHSPGSANYHQWLTPAQFGAQFGASDQDIATISTWLGNHGFNVTKVNPGKGSIEFSGNVGQLRDTFHTQIHKYLVNGETHYANANDPQIPAALASVVGGFTSLNNFHPRSYLHKLGEASFNPTSHQVTPQWTQASGSGVFYVLAPGDFAKQYDLTPLYNASVNGTGQTIAIINESNINISLVNQFRTLFNLPANPPQVIIDGNDPGVDGVNNPDGPNYASFEAYLDVEWAGAVAPNATVDLVIAADTSLESGLLLAMEHAVYSNVAPVLSLSFGNCESSLGSYNGFVNNLWEQAAAQGQTVMVSTGDAGSAGCDDDNSQDYAVDGQAVNGFASTPYNVAVGGTDFYYSQYLAGSSALTSQINTYWNSTASQLPAVSLQGYIPEQPWNDSQYGLDAVNYYTQESGSTATTIAAGGGGASGAAICSTNTYSSTTGACTGSLTGYAKPSWQSGTGVPADTVRDLPDVSLFSANGNNYSFYPICAEDGDCQTANLGISQVQISGVGGTSASAPSFAGIMALVNQQYGRQGQADTVLYPLATQYPAAFHDVAVGSNSVPCNVDATSAGEAESPNCIAAPAGLSYSVDDPTYGTAVEGQIGSTTTSTAEYNAGAGYDLASGLGTVDANALVTNWNKISLAASATTLTPPSPATFAHGTPVTIAGTVTGSTPTGNVALMTDSSEPNQQGQGLATTLNGFVGAFANGTFALNGSGQYTGSVSTLPGGTYDIWTSYGGDSKNAGSTSTKIPITVTAENSGVFLQAIAPTAVIAGGSNISGTVDYGTQIELSAQVAPSSQLSTFETCSTSCPVFTLPTGQVTFSDTGSPALAPNTAVINAEGDAEYNPPFAVGTHTITASYSGDQSYNKSTSSTISLTVAKDSPQLQLYTTLQTNSGSLISGSGQQTIVTVEVSNNAQYGACNPSTTTGACQSGGIYPVPVAPPTGTINIGSSNLTGFSGSVALSPYTDPSTGAVSGVANFAIPANTASGNYNATVAYSGDGNYTSISAQSLTIPVQNINSDGALASVTSATVTGSISPTTSVTVTGTVSGQSGHAAPTGYIYIYSSGNFPTQVFVNPPASGVVSTFSVTLNSQTLFQGSNFVTLQYSGDTNYNPSTFVLNNNGAISNPLTDFSLVPNSTIVPVNISGGSSSGTDTINVASVNGFTGQVSLTCAAASPLSCTISPNPTLSNSSSTTSTLTINVPSGTANGNFNVSIIGQDSTGAFIHTLGITAEVSGTVTTPTFSLSNSGAISIQQGATTGNTSTMTVTPANAFTGTVNLSCSVTTTLSSPTSPVTCTIPTSVNISSASAATATLTANSTATTTAGAYVITVTAQSGSISQTSTVNVTVMSTATANFSLTSNPTGISNLNPGATTGNTSVISVTASGGFSGSIALTCSISPTAASDPATCSLSPTSITPGQTSTLTVSTTAATADLVVPKTGNGKGWLGASSGALLALLVFFGIPARRRSWRSMLGLFVILVVLGGLSSCGGGVSNSGGSGGGGSPSNPGTTAGSYTVTVTGTSGSLTHTTSVTVSIN